MSPGAVASDKANGSDSGMIADRLNSGYTTMHNVQYTGRKSWVVGDFLNLKAYLGVLPARWHNSAMIMEAPGSRSDGLRMRVLPVVIAMGIVHKGIMLEDLVK
jgi:hypothetical protein